MSYFRTLGEHFALDGPSYQDFDHAYPRKTRKIPTKEMKMVTPEVSEEEQGSAAEAPRELLEGPRSLALAQVASNAVHAAWEAGYALGFNQGRLAGLDDAIAIVNKRPVAKPEPEIDWQKPF